MGPPNWVPKAGSQIRVPQFGYLKGGPHGTPQSVSPKGITPSWVKHGGSNKICQWVSLNGGFPKGFPQGVSQICGLWRRAPGGPANGFQHRGLQIIWSFNWIRPSVDPQVWSHKLGPTIVGRQKRSTNWGTPCECQKLSSPISFHHGGPTTLVLQSGSPMVGPPMCVCM